MSDTTEPIWEKCSPASYELDGTKVIFPVSDSIECEGGIRVVERAIPWVDGEQLDETGAKGDVFEVTAFFVNDISQFEEGIGSDPPLYPDRLEQLIALFKKRKTATVNLVTRRNIRAKAVSWRRVETGERLDCATLRITFREDNEAKLDSPAAGGVTVRASLQSAIEEATFEAERAGIRDSSWENLTLAASQLASLISMPNEFREDIAQKADRVARACDTIIDSYQSNDEGRGALLDPGGWVAMQALITLRDLADHADEEARPGHVGVVAQNTTTQTNIWVLSTEHNVDPELLLKLNPTLEDPSYIPAGTSIKYPRS